MFVIIVLSGLIRGSLSKYSCKKSLLPVSVVKVGLKDCKIVFPAGDRGPLSVLGLHRRSSGPGLHMQAGV